MALWPFRRRSGRKRARSGTLSDSEGVAHGDRVDRPRGPVASGSPVRRRSTVKKRRTEPSSTHDPRARRNSFSPGRPDSIHVDHRRRRDMDRAHLVGVDPWMRPGGHSNERIEEETMRTGAPTLHGKGHGQRMSRRKSSKRRRTDHDREAEIKAMTSPAQTRTRTETWNFTRPTRTSSKRVKTIGAPPARAWEHHTSDDASLPTADSIRSGASSDSDHGAFRLATLASLAPHPKLHYITSPGWGSPTPPPPSRGGSQKRKLAERAPVEDTKQARKRIDDLANDFDASDIRELMERDNRRRERKKLRDQARAERRISRMAEERKAAQAKAAREGSRPPPNLERGVAGRELADSDVDATSAVVTSSRPRRASPGQPQREAPPQGAVPETGSQSHTREPLSEFHSTNNIPRDIITPQDGPEASPPIETYAPPSPTSPVLGRFSKSRKNASKSSLGAGQSKSTLSSPPARLEEVKTNQSEGLRKVRTSISALLRWGTRRSRRDSGPSSFSNTSREEMQAAAERQAAASPPAVPPVAAATDSGVSVVPTRKLSVGVPKRTRSRFKEDLPELPLSPPDSRRASLDATPPIPEHPDLQRAANKDSRTSSPTDGFGDETMRQTPVSQHEDQYGQSPAPHSISLASVDSEGSWLSGRMGPKRSPGSRQTLREQAASRAASTNGTEEELGLTEDEYLARLAPARLMRTMPSQRQPPSATDAIASSDEDELMNEGDVKLGAVNARRQPDVVHASARPSAVSRMSHHALITSCDEEHGRGAQE